MLLKDYPEPQRSEILDLVFTPKYCASVSALYVEIPGDGNAHQGSMPSHMDEYKLSMAWFDNLVIKAAAGKVPAPSRAMKGQQTLYPAQKSMPSGKK